MDKEDLLTILKRDLTDEDALELYNIINHIFIHPEFKERLTNKFLHHGNTTLGMHIIKDTILTWKLSKAYLNKKHNDNYRIDLAVKIAMFHDLYTIPWQNNSLTVNEKFFNKHGFRHPIEAVINAYSWYKDDFSNLEEAKIIIDGIVHHMYPFPVIVMDNSIVNNRELVNFNLFQKMPDEIKELIYETTERGKIGSVSVSKSKYIEGRIMSKADKKASLNEFDSFSSLTALLTGKNKKISK